MERVLEARNDVNNSAQDVRGRKIDTQTQPILEKKNSPLNHVFIFQILLTEYSYRSWGKSVMLWKFHFLKTDLVVEIR